MAEHRGGWDHHITPKRVFGALAVLLVLAVLLAPWPDTSATPPVSSYGTHPEGARGIFEVIGRLGFPVERRLRPLRDSLSTDAVYVILDPVVPLTSTEVNTLLGTVRDGAGLLVVPPLGSDLADSLGIRREAVLRSGDEPADIGDGFVRYVLRPARRAARRDSVFVPPPGGRVFVETRTQDGTRAMIAGLPIGRGRVIVAADPTVFHNSVIRRGEAAVRVVRLIEWLTPAPQRRPIIFDEYHHGFGTHANPLGVARRTLTNTQPGRVLLQAGTAALILLIALGVRPIRPRARTRIERRSPLEHVGALARAYRTVGATPIAARLLVRGLIRRHGGMRPGRDDRAFLQGMAQRVPAMASDVHLLTAVLDGHRSTDAIDVARAIRRIERQLST